MRYKILRLPFLQSRLAPIRIDVMHIRANANVMDSCVKAALTYASKAEVKVSRNGPERRSGKRIVAGTAFRLEFQVH